MTRWFHDLILSHLSVKWMSDSKSAPQITLRSSRTQKSRQRSLASFDLSWPRLTRLTSGRTGWPVESMSTTWYYMSAFISLAKTAMLLSYVPRNAFSAWHDPSYDVIGQILGESGSWNFQGGDVKKTQALYSSTYHYFCTPLYIHTRSAFYYLFIYLIPWTTGIFSTQ